MKFLNTEIEQCHNQYISLRNAADEAAKISEEAHIFNRKKLENAAKKALDAFISYAREVYAKSIYATYTPLRPTLIRRRTGEIYTWEQAFGKAFEELNILEKDALVCLIEGEGKYKFQ